MKSANYFVFQKAINRYKIIYRTIKSFLIIFIIHFCISPALYAQSIEINEITRDYSWAHHSNKLSALYGDHVAIFQPGKSEAIQDINLLDYYSSIEWTIDDKNFILGADNIVYLYDISKNSISEYIKIDGCGTTWNISAIAINPDSKYWAFISNCEAFPCLHIYSGKNKIKTFDFGKAANAKLYVKNDSITVCIKPFYKEDGIKTVFTFYPPYYKSFITHNNNFPDTKSYDGRYSASIKSDEDETSIIIISKSNE